MGHFTKLTCLKLSEKKIVNIKLNDDFYKKLIETYLFLRNETTAKKDQVQISEKLKDFIRCLPTLQKIKRVISKRDFLEKKTQSLFFMKICLDIYDDFYSNYDYPFFMLFKKFVQTVTYFYKYVSRECFDYLSSAMKDRKLRGKFI